MTILVRPSTLRRMLLWPFHGTLNARLGRALRDGSPERAERMLALGADPDGALPNGFTPLTLNHMHGDALCARLARALLGAGADPDKPNGAGMRPLHYAALFGLAELCAALADAGADPAALNEGGLAPSEHMRKFFAANAQLPGSAGIAIAAEARMDLIDAILERAALRAASASAPSAGGRGRL